MYLFFLSIILIIGSLAAILFVDVVMLRYVSATICLVGVYMMHLYWRNLFVKVRGNAREKNAALQHQLDELKDRFEVATNENKALTARIAKLNHVPDILETPSLYGRIGILSNYFSDDITGKQKSDYKRLFAELEDAAATKAMMKAIETHTTKPMVEELKASSLPLDEETRKQFEGKLMCLALTAIDCTCGFKSGLNDTGSLATKVASGEISEAQAVRQAKEANENIYETPKEIRVLRELVNEYYSDCKLVYDYKL